MIKIINRTFPIFSIGVVFVELNITIHASLKYNLILLQQYGNSSAHSYYIFS